MSNGRKSFLLHFDSLGILDQLTDEQCGKLFLACRDFNLGEELKLDATLELVFFPFKAQFIRDKEKYQNKVHASQINGSKGGRPKNPAKPKKPSGLSGNPAKAKKGVSDSVNDSESVSDSDIKPLVAFAPVDSWMCEFETFWMIYDKKEGRHKCELKFKKLTKADKDSLFTLLPAYIQSTPDKQYRKNPLTWLNGKHWNDEITTPVNQSLESMNTDLDWAKGLLS